MTAQQKPGVAGGPAPGSKNFPCANYSPVDRFLSRLFRVRETGPSRWMALCPTAAHPRGDRSAGLSIRETKDGRLLIHCFAGCAVESIVSAVGLDLRNLFPPRLESPSLTGIRPAVPKFRAGELINLAAYEAALAGLVCGDILAGRPVTSDDLERARRAVDTLATLAVEVGHGR